MGDFLPFLGIFIFIAIQIFKASNKSKGSKGGSIFDELEEKIRKIEERAASRSMGQEVYEEKDYLNPLEEYTPLSEEANLREYQPISKEILQAPYSNLEEGIIDDVHRSKFPHHSSGDSGQMPSENKLPAHEIFKDVDPKKAFIYSLIFERKYF